MVNTKILAAYWPQYLHSTNFVYIIGQTEDIAMTIRQLQLTAPDLGGEPYKSELERLLGKYGR